jgi:hypothetical protein
MVMKAPSVQAPNFRESSSSNFEMSKIGAWMLDASLVLGSWTLGAYLDWNLELIKCT